MVIGRESNIPTTDLPAGFENITYDSYARLRFLERIPKNSSFCCSFSHHTKHSMNTFLSRKTCIKFLPSRVTPCGSLLLSGCFIRKTCLHIPRVMPSSKMQSLSPTLWLILDACVGACDSSCRAFQLYLRKPRPSFLPSVRGFRYALIPTKPQSIRVFLGVWVFRLYNDV